MVVQFANKCSENMMKILLLVRAQINVHSVESFPMTILELPAHYEFLNCENFQKYFSCKFKSTIRDIFFFEIQHCYMDGIFGRIFINLDELYQ